MKILTTLCTISLSSLLLTACGSENGPKRIVLGTTNVLYTPTELQYSKPFVVQVTRENEHPAAGANVTITVVPVRYFKGEYSGVDTDNDMVLDAWGLFYSAGCAAEDINLNSILDPGEDINGNGRLEPTFAATVDSHPTLLPTVTQGTGSLVTNQDGFGYFVITYPRSEANWSQVQLTATANVDGTEKNEIYTATLSLLAEDLTYPYSPPGGVNSRYGISAFCTDAL
jgi:hypothetical protein